MAARRPSPVSSQHPRLSSRSRRSVCMRQGLNSRAKLLPRIAAPAAVLFALALSSSARAELPTLVRDLSPGDRFGNFGVAPSVLYAAGKKLYFTAASNPHTLWVSDGTASGTRPLVGLCNNPNDICGTRFVASRGDLVLFLSVDDDADVHLWRTDGTAAGTFPLTLDGPPLNPFAFDNGKYAVLGSSLYFVEENWTNGPTQRLWKTNGAVAGTTLVADLTTTRFVQGQ